MRRPFCIPLGLTRKYDEALASTGKEPDPLQAVRQQVFQVIDQAVERGQEAGIAAAATQGSPGRAGPAGGAGTRRSTCSDSRLAPRCGTLLRANRMSK